MKKDSDKGENREIDPFYENGQSDAEKLMSRHLQTPGHQVTDEDLKNIRIGHAAPLPAKADTDITAAENRTEEDTDQIGPDKLITPLNVLGG